MPTNRRRTQPVTDETVSQVKWESPPATGKVKYNWPKIAARLRAKPGEWALIYRQDRLSVANAVRQGHVRDVLPGDGFEVRTANTNTVDRTCSLYLRWNPKG